MPETLEILGHEAAASTLKTLYRSDGPHTLLLAGPDGVGRRPLARWLAAFLNCLSTEPDTRPCGTCASCRAVADGTHPDLREIAPAQTTRTGRQRRRLEITIDHLVARPNADPDPLGPWLERRPRHRRRVAIVDHAEALNVNAANAFLKMLEEPPRWATIVLVSTGPEALLPTVASRCATVRLGAVDVGTFARLSPHPALRLGLPGPLLRAERDPQAWEAARDAARRLMSSLGGSLGDALQAAEALASASGEPDAPTPTEILREPLRELPPYAYAAALDALERCEGALASYASAELAFTALALDLRALAARTAGA